MKVIIITLALLAINTLGYSQNSINELLLSEAIHKNFETYKLAISQVNFKNEPHKSEQIFSEFVGEQLANTYFDNFKAKNLNDALIRLNDYFKKPMVIITYASWDIIEDKSTLEVNRLAKEHHDNIDFVVLFWENRNIVRQKAKHFNKKVNVLYIDERENIFSHEIKNMKHSLGQSLIYYLNKDNKLVDIQKNDYFISNNIELQNSSYVFESNQRNSLKSLLTYDHKLDNRLVLD